PQHGPGTHAGDHRCALRGLDEEGRQLAALVLRPRALLRSRVPSTPGDDHDVRFARREAAGGRKRQSVGPAHRALAGGGDQSDGKVDTEVLCSPQNLVRAQRVQLIETVKDHDVGAHDPSVEEVIANDEYDANGSQSVWATRDSTDPRSTIASVSTCIDCPIT